MIKKNNPVWLKGGKIAIIVALLFIYLGAELIFIEDVLRGREFRICASFGGRCGYYYGIMGNLGLILILIPLWPMKFVTLISSSLNLESPFSMLFIVFNLTVLSFVQIFLIGSILGTIIGKISQKFKGTKGENLEKSKLKEDWFNYVLILMIIIFIILLVLNLINEGFPLP